MEKLHKVHTCLRKGVLSRNKIFINELLHDRSVYNWFGIGKLFHNNEYDLRTVKKTLTWSLPFATFASPLDKCICQNSCNPKSKVFFFSHHQYYPTNHATSPIFVLFFITLLLKICSLSSWSLERDKKQLLKHWKSLFPHATQQNMI